MFYRALLPAFLAAALGCAFLPQAKANEWNHRTLLTFNQPVEVPGMVLGAGSYTFRLFNSDSDRHIVQIFNQDDTRLVTTVLAIPDYRLQPTGRTVVTFEERTAGAPEAIKEWFYPGANYGEEFVYGHARPIQVASVAAAPAPAPMPPAHAEPAPPAVQNPEPAPVATAAPAPEQQPEQIAQATKPAEPAATPEPAPAPTQNKELPHTASNAPLIGLLGLASLGLAGAVRFTAKSRSGSR